MTVKPFLTSSPTIADRTDLPEHEPVRLSCLTGSVPLSAFSTGDVAQLTGRERAILSLLARGASNREISEALCIASGTVKNHLSNILGKPGVRDRTQAALQAREPGLLQQGASSHCSRLAVGAQGHSEDLHIGIVGQSETLQRSAAVKYDCISKKMDIAVLGGRRSPAGILRQRKALIRLG